MLKHFIGLIFCCATMSTQAQKLIKEFTPGSGSTYFYFMGNTQNGFIMNVYNSNTGVEPWVSDGTSNGTKILQDIIPGNMNSLFNNECYSNDTLLYFFAFRNNGRNSVDLWRTDGTVTGTFFIDSMENIYPNKYYGDAMFYKGEFYYFTSSPSYKTLYATDGSRNKPRKIYTFKDSNYASRSNIKIFNDRLYFYGNDPKHGVELWSTDGTSAGTKLVFDLYTGSKSSMYNNGQLLACRDKLFFVAQRDFREGYELFYISSINGGPWLFNDYTPNSGISSFVSLAEGNDSFFFFNVMNTSPPQSFVSDGNMDNTRKFHNPKDPEPNEYYYTYGVQRTKNFTLVSSYTNGTGLEFFKSDPQLNNLGLLRDINPGIGSSLNGNISKIFEVNGKAYFLGFNFMLGNDIWVTDGTTDSTIIYFEFPNNNQNTSDILHQWNNRLFFAETVDLNIGTELYELNINRNTGIVEHDLSTYSIYPNPIRAGEQLHLPETITQISMYNSMGQLVWQEETKDGNCQIPENLCAGLYHLFLDHNTAPIKIILQ